MVISRDFLYRSGFGVMMWSKIHRP